MEEKIMSLLFMKIYTFILLRWTCLFCNDISTFNKHIDEKHNFDGKLNTRICRLLAKSKINNNSSIIWLKTMENNCENEQKDICTDAKMAKGKNKNSSISSLKKGQYYKQVIDYNNGFFDGKHFQFERKWVKKIDHDDYIEKNRMIATIASKKLKFRKYRYIVYIFLPTLLVGIGMPILQKYKCLPQPGDAFYNALQLEKWWDKALGAIMGQARHHFFYMVYGVILIAIVILIVTVTFKILKNKEIYNNIKLRAQLNE
ncbi:fam-m protein [Plasmodium brasilianum]|uniref:Fam-m protein n=1 Tax=Plasmodium brasilianum TaxID=5824 RepID=A0ACB9YDS7_PLABR|nr:fam-m protein [Plasmodium brasilianum]